MELLKNINELMTDWLNSDAELKFRDLVGEVLSTYAAASNQTPIRLLIESNHIHTNNHTQLFVKK